MKEGTRIVNEMERRVSGAEMAGVVCWNPLVLVSGVELY